MDMEKLREIDMQMRKEKPKLFLLVTPDAPASDSEIATVEDALGTALPPIYKAFLKEFGGGAYGLTNVFSATIGSEFYLPNMRSQAASYLPTDLLPFSDDYAGGDYVLKIEDGVASDRVLYWSPDGGLIETPFSNVLEYVARYAYRAA